MKTNEMMENLFTVHYCTQQIIKLKEELTTYQMRECICSMMNAVSKIWKHSAGI